MQHSTQCCETKFISANRFVSPSTIPAATSRRRQPIRRSPPSPSPAAKCRSSLAAQGLTARETADRLGISPLTARKHRENLMRKLSLHNTAEIAAYALRIGLPIG